MWLPNFRFDVHFAAFIVGALSCLHVSSAEQRPPATVEEKERIVEASPPPSAPWVPAVVGKDLLLRERVRTGELSRATVRLSNEHLVRVNANSQLVIVPSLIAGKPLGLDLQKGEIYLHSRGVPMELGLRTPSVTGTPHGTEFRVRVEENGTTTFTMFDGEVELENAHGKLHIGINEQAVIEPGRAPRKTAMIAARNTIQWCLYYPGVLHVPDLGLSAGDNRILRKSIEAYESGDLLGALDRWPGRYHAASQGGKLFRAMIVLATGQVDEARGALAGVAKDTPGRRAIEEMMDAVNYVEREMDREPATASEWLARSYYEQSRSHLDSALAAAKKATVAAPESGYAWARVAELLFSFGQTQNAGKALDRGIQLAPRNAQAHALQGFLFAAQNHISKARASFGQAIALDGALANAWLGRGLTSIRQGHEQKGRRDMQVAAALEPNRSILRSYLGKAASQIGSNAKANLELDRGQKLDPKDPTPWLYSAIQRTQENRYNEAVADLEKSLDLNDNRRVYRSQFLLDQDRAVRSANLAAIYLKEGMENQSVREAVRAVNSDYGSASAHLLLANSYDALRDPRRVVLRYETAWFNELLLSNLLSPVGGGSLSQFVSQQEYVKLFEKDGVGMSSVFDYRSDGQLHETASQYGRLGNFDYAIDAEYQYNRGVRLNNRLSDLEYTGTFKLQLGIADSLFMQVRFSDLRTGDVYQYYDPNQASSKAVPAADAQGNLLFDNKGNPILTKGPNPPNLTYHLREHQNPGTLLLGWHHEWSPGNHTLLLLGRQASSQQVTMKQTGVNVVTRDVGAVAPPGAAAEVNVDPDTFAFTLTPHFPQIRGLTGMGNVQDLGIATFDLNYWSMVEIYSAELQQIATLGMQTFVFGGRYQSGQFNTISILSNVGDNLLAPLVDTSASQRGDVVNFQRVNLYFYDTWRVAKWLSITGGVTYDSMRYPANFRNPPTSGQQTGLDKVSPKVGIVMEPWRGATIRAAYAEAISGTSFDESVRLEPTQVAGFLQAYRSIASESLVGSVAGSRYRFSGLSLEQKLPTRTYFGIEYDRIIQNVERTVGAYDFLNVGGNIAGIEPSTLGQSVRYHEDVLTVTLNQLLGERWALGARYRYTRSKLDMDYPALSNGISNAQYPGAVDNLAKSSVREVANFHELSLYALYNHPCGFFARAEANWYQQSNSNFVTDGNLSTADPVTGIVNPVLQTTDQALPSSDFWQFNAHLGYRFYRNRCEVSCGVLNMGGRDYRLNPVNPYAELPRERTFVVRCKLVF